MDACLIGIGGRWSNFVYHLAIGRCFMIYFVVHLEIVNIVLAVRLFQVQWSGRWVLIRCDNEAVVSVLRSGRTRDPYLGACARNIWYVSPLTDMDLQYAHIRGQITFYQLGLKLFAGTSRNSICTQLSWCQSRGRCLNCMP